jgi:hypothetical protein
MRRNSACTRQISEQIIVADLEIRRQGKSHNERRERWQQKSRAHSEKDTASNRCESHNCERPG